MQIEAVQTRVRRIYNENEKVMHDPLQHAQFETFGAYGRIRAVQEGFDIERLQHLKH